MKTHQDQIVKTSTTLKTSTRIAGIILRFRSAGPSSGSKSGLDRSFFMWQKGWGLWKKCDGDEFHPIGQAESCHLVFPKALKSFWHVAMNLQTSLHHHMSTMLKQIWTTKVSSSTYHPSILAFGIILIFGEYAREPRNEKNHWKNLDSRKMMYLNPNFFRSIAYK